MPHCQARETPNTIVITTDWWEAEHLKAAGGAWQTLVFKYGSGQNLLRRPATSAVRFVQAVPHSEDAQYPAFLERNEPKPLVRLEKTPEGFPVIVTEGAFRDEAGKALPLGFRRRTEYHDYGLVWSTLQLLSDAGCDEVVEVRALELALRPGLTDCYVRFHPSQAGGSDLLGGHGWYDLAHRTHPVVFQSRFTPLQIMCFQRGVEGLELFPGSELAQWDCAFKPDPGLGLYQVTQQTAPGTAAPPSGPRETRKDEPDAGTLIELNPYCMPFRRMKIRVQGVVTLRLGFGLPFIKQPERTASKYFHVQADSRWPSDEQLGGAAEAGAKLLRFHNDYREDGPFWHDGVYPPYDEAGMTQLGRVVETAHKLGMRAVPYVSLKEFHPDAPGFADHAHEWMHMAAPSLGIIHTWAGTGQYGGLMCLQSGWLDFRKRGIDAILSGLAWDGLYFDWCAAHPCSHPGHARGPFHSDVEGFLELLRYCRTKVGPQGILFLHLSGLPSLVAENMADLVFFGEDVPGTCLRPGQCPPQADFIPIAPRHMVATAAGGSADARRLIMSGILQGHPLSARVPAAGFDQEVLAEMRLFAGLDLTPYAFYPATAGAWQTGQTGVYAAVWVKPDGMLLYVGNFSPAERRGTLKCAQRGALPDEGARLVMEARRPGAPPPAAPGNLARGELTERGIPYHLAPLASCLLVLTS